MFRDGLKRLLRAYPTLNLSIAVPNHRGEADIVLPGLRYDDIANTGQPDIWRVYDMVNRVEHAALHAEYPFLDFTTLTNLGLGVLAKAVQVHIRDNFYEYTTPKAPIHVHLKLVHIGSHTFTTAADVCCGGRSVPSIRVLTLYNLLHMKTMLSEKIPDWWRAKFVDKLAIQNEKLFNIEPLIKPQHTFSHAVTVPLVDTDTNGRVRCSSFMRYFLDNASIASQKAFYFSIGNNFHMYYPKRMSLLYIRPGNWGDCLHVESWEVTTDGRPVLGCHISNNNQMTWCGEMSFHGPIIGLPYPSLKP